MSCYCLSTTTDEETQRAVADLLAITGRDEIENNTRGYQVYHVYGTSLANETVQHLHRVLTHSSTRPSDPRGMQPVFDPAVNRRCVFATLCMVNSTFLCCAMKHKTRLWSIVYYFTQRTIQSLSPVSRIK